jgi:hypothetical protein
MLVYRVQSKLVIVPVRASSRAVHFNSGSYVQEALLLSLMALTLKKVGQFFSEGSAHFRFPICLGITKCMIVPI